MSDELIKSVPEEADRNIFSAIRIAVTNLGKFVTKNFKFTEEYEAMDPFTGVPKPESISTAQMRAGARIAAGIDFSKSNNRKQAKTK